MGRRGPRLSAVTLAAALCAVLPAGCLDGVLPPSHRMTVDVSYTVAVAGDPTNETAEWVVLLPALYANEGRTAVAPVQATATAPSSEASMEVLEDAEYGRVARAGGRGPVVFSGGATYEGPDIGAAESYGHYVWSTAVVETRAGSETREPAVMVFPVSPSGANVTLEVTVSLVGRSDFCSRTGLFTGTVEAAPEAQASWQPLFGQDQVQCQ
jgi:hypothetical protein